MLDEFRGELAILFGLELIRRQTVCATWQGGISTRTPGPTAVSDPSVVLTCRCGYGLKNRRRGSFWRCR